VKIFGDSNFSRLQKTLKNAFLKIKDEFDDHRETINQNTNEIQANYEYLCRIDSKIDKLNERIDEITLFLKPETERKRYNVSPLTRREKEVFLAVYASDEAVGYVDIAKRTALTENLVICYISNLVTKGIPILKKYTNDSVKLSIDNEFKEYQMKENIIGIDEDLSQNIVM